MEEKYLWCWTVRDRRGYAVGYGFSIFGSAVKAREDLGLVDDIYVGGGGRLYVNKDKVDKTFRVGKSVR